LIDDENKSHSITAVYKSIPNIACSETIKKYIDLNLKNIPIAANHIRSILPIRKINQIINNKTLEQIIYESHRPTSINEGIESIKTLDKLAALFALEKANSGFRLTRSLKGKKIESKVPWQVFLKALPFQLTSSQIDAISNIIKEFDKPYPMRGMLQGDVGSGKTAVYGLVAAYVAWSGQRVAVLMPNDTLAQQVYEEITGWFPKLNGILVNGKNKIKELNPFQLIVGTTAVLFREYGEFGLVIIDEQQKFSREQRELLLSDGTHLLEVSATPIPRSVALLKHGSTSVWKIKGNHSNKKIVTKVLTQKDMVELIYMVKNHVDAGNQCIIVYPLVNESQAECMEGIMPVVSAYQKWDKMYPGQVVMAHSEMKPEEKAESILKMKNREARILVSTTVIEVGVTIPGVMLLAVIRADRMGLVTLHQLRGRIARQGGVGDFLLCLPQDKVSEKTMRRMNVLVEHEDGFDVAELDLALRGFGDLSSDSNEQSGADKSFLPTRTIAYDLVNELMEKFV
jgi:ATP-dependent DNA helicase RecG